MILIGEMSLWVALVMAIWTATVSLIGARLGRRDLIASGERGIHASLGMVILAALGLWAALFTHDFSIEYVASLTSANLPRIYTFAAFWAGEAGSLLFMVLVLSIASSVAVYASRTIDRATVPYVTATLGLVMASLIAVSCIAANPFARSEWPPAEGRGMDPLFQDPGMLLHPPSLYIGFAGAAVAFALSIGALAKRSVDARLLQALRSSTLISWIFLTIGLATGMRWAYVEPSLGSTWLLDPLLDASLFPWVASTALLASLTRRFARRALRSVTVLLVASAFILSFYSVSATRGGIVHSVRWFPMSTMTAFFTAFIVIAIVATVYLAKRGAEVAKPEAVPETVTDSASVRRANRYGLFAVGVGAILILGALAAQAFSGEHTVTLRPGDSRSVTDPFGREFTFISQGLSRYDVLNRHVIALTLDLQKEGSRVGVLTAERRQHVDGRGAPAFEPSTESGIRTGLAQDIVVFPSGLSQDGTAELRIRFNPFVALLWIGIAIAAIGWVVAMGSMTPYPVANAR